VVDRHGARRRHSELTVIETHAGGGQYDSLSLLRDGQTLLSINRGGNIHAHQHPMEPLLLEDAFAADNPLLLIHRLEAATHLAGPAKTPKTTPKTLTYRVLTQLAMATVNEADPLDIRSEFLDSSGGGGCPRGLLAQFPVAAERCREHRTDDPVGIPEHRYWLVLGHGTALAALDVDGYAYLEGQVLYLPTVYAASGRRLARTVTNTLGSLLP